MASDIEPIALTERAAMPTTRPVVENETMATTLKMKSMMTMGMPLITAMTAGRMWRRTGRRKTVASATNIPTPKPTIVGTSVRVAVAGMCDKPPSSDSHQEAGSKFMPRPSFQRPSAAC